MNASTYNLKYKTFDEAFQEIILDFRMYSSENLLDPQSLIKVARKCNYMLGWKIYKTRQVILEVDRGKALLPEDMHLLNYAFICGSYTIEEALPQGTHIEERTIAPDYKPYPEVTNSCEIPENSCSTIPDPCTKVCINDCGDKFELVQKIKYKTTTYTEQYPLKIVKDKLVDCDCPNINMETKNIAFIKDGFLITNFESGKIYLNYLGDMINDEGELLLLDHELINEYYEYSFKERILENLIMNGENVGDKYNLIVMKLREAKNNALSLVNTPDFKELQDVWRINRKAMTHKFYNMFKS